MIRMFQSQDQEFVVKEITRVDKASGTGGSARSGFLARQYMRFWNILPQPHLQPQDPQQGMLRIFDFSSKNSL